MKGRGPVPALALAGNAAALVLLLLVLAARSVLFGDPAAPPPAPPRSSPAAPRIAGPVVLVVVDGLRDDVSRDPRLMPNLVSLARRGGRGTARVGTLVPSTVAGIRTLAEGAAPPPASFFRDFGAPRSPGGGLFAAAAAAGIRAFAAGPHLWHDLYGPWLAGGLRVGTVRGRDEEVVRAGVRALEEDGFGLVVVHLSGPDDAAHLSGRAGRGRPSAYQEAVAEADAALGRLLAAAEPGAAVLVTADHGAAGSGGHAGMEEEVVTVPVVVHGPAMPRGGLGAMRQRGIHRLLLGPLGLPPLPSAPPPARPGPGALLAAGFAGLAAVAVPAVLLLGIWPGWVPGGLNAALWLALAAALAGPPGSPLLIAFGALAAASAPLARSAGRPAALSTAVLAAGAGAAAGALRLLDAGSPAVPPWALPAALLAGAALGAACGRLLAFRARFAVVAGVMAAALPALVARLAGETASLSTLDVRLAFRLVDGPLGLPGAVAAAALRQTLPALVVLLGLAPSLGRAGPRVIPFAAGLGAGLAGQAAAAASVLLLVDDSALASRAVGLLARLAGETTALFLGSAAAVSFGSRSPRRATPPTLRGR